MSDFSQGPGWWQASDGKWYPPEQAPGGAPAAGPAPGGYPPAGPPPAYGAPAGYGAPAAGGSSWGTLAEWPDRALSALIDYFGLWILANIVSNTISWSLGSLISLVALGWGFYNAYLNGQTGQSTGKRVTGTKVVSEATGQPIGGGQGVIRAIAHLLDWIPCGIGFLWPLWDAKKQTFADKVIKTVVVTGLPKQAFGDAIKPS